MTDTTLFKRYTLGSLTLANRIVMAPLTRNRAGAGGPLSHAATMYSAVGISGCEPPQPSGLWRRRLIRALLRAYRERASAFRLRPELVGRQVDECSTTA